MLPNIAVSASPPVMGPHSPLRQLLCKPRWGSVHFSCPHQRWALPPRDSSWHLRLTSCVLAPSPCSSLDLGFPPTPQARPMWELEHRGRVGSQPRGSWLSIPLGATSWSSLAPPVSVGGGSSTEPSPSRLQSLQTPLCHLSPPSPPRSPCWEGGVAASVCFTFLKHPPFHAHRARPPPWFRMGCRV